MFDLLGHLKSNIGLFSRNVHFKTIRISAKVITAILTPCSPSLPFALAKGREGEQGKIYF